MRLQPTYQKQHKLSKVYLKQFSYKSGEVIKEKMLVSVLNVLSGSIENHDISHFTTDTNIYDLPKNIFGEHWRHYEDTASKIENFYPSILNNIERQGQLIWRDQDKLNHFVALQLGRCHYFRHFIELILTDKIATENLFKELSLFNTDLLDLKVYCKLFQGTELLNIILCSVTQHLMLIFRHFQKVILSGPVGFNWSTTDQPVLLIKNGVSNSILPLESEILFPLSPKYSLYMYHDSFDNHQLEYCKLKANKVHVIQNTSQLEELFGLINDNLRHYLIMPIKVESQKLVG